VNNIFGEGVHQGLPYKRYMVRYTMQLEDAFSM